MLWIRHLIPFAVLAAAALGGAALYQEGERRLDGWLRIKLSEALAKENLRADIGRMTLDPLRGLVARDCRLYGGPEQTLLLATIDRLQIEADVSRLLQRQQFISSVEISEGALALPINLESPNDGWLKLTQLNAQVLASGDQFEVRHAHGLLEGVPVTVEGTLLKPTRFKRDRDRPPGEKREALDLIRDRRDWLDRIREQIAQFNWENSPRPPRLELRLSGDLDRPGDIQLWARLRGEAFRYRDYAVDEIDVLAEWTRGETVVREFRLSDDVGTLVGSARLGPGRSGLSFQFSSSANLPALAGAVHDMPALREFVLYEPNTLSISGEGTWRPAAADGSAPGSLRLLGRLASGRFATRGVVFNTISAAFFVDDGDLHLRELRLAHDSGTLDGQVMRQDGAWRYRTQMRMNPTALQPFLTVPEWHRIMDRIDFQDYSTLELEASGRGQAGDAASWEHTASVDARQLRYQGEVVHRVKAAVARSAGQTLVRGVRVVRPEGEITAASLRIDETAHTLQIEDLRSTVFPVPILQCINPKIVQFAQPYAFSAPPTVQLSGRLGMKSAEPNDFTLDVTTVGEVDATLPDRTVLPLRAPHGKMVSQGAQLALDLTGQVRAGAAWQGTVLDEDVTARFLGTFPLVPPPERSESWQFFLNGPAKARQKVGETTLQLEFSKASADFRHQRGEAIGATVQIEAEAKVLPPVRWGQLTLLDGATSRFQGVFEAAKRTAGDDRTHWSVAVASGGTAEWTVGKTALPLDQWQLQADFRRDRLNITRATARVFGGTVTGSGEIDHLSSTRDFIAAIQADGVDFGPLARVYAPTTETGGQLSGGFRLAARARPRAGDASNLRGAGQAVVREGDIFALPLLGPLSPMLSSVLPGTKSGYSKAREARATFTLADGVLTTRDFEALTTAFVIKGGGTINLNTKGVDLLARINTRGPTGMLLYPVSRLLEYEANGTTTDPEWKPAVLTLPGRLLPLPGGRRR